MSRGEAANAISARMNDSDCPNSGRFRQCRHLKPYNHPARAKGANLVAPHDLHNRQLATELNSLLDRRLGCGLGGLAWDYT